MTSPGQRLSLAGLLALAACATTPNVIVQQLEGEVQQCATVGWEPLAGFNPSLADQFIRREVMAGLKARGYVEAAADPACRLDASFTVREKLVSSEGPRVGVGAGGGSGGSYGGVGISLPVGKRKDLTGTFRLRVIEASGNQEIWSGSVDDSYAAEEMTEAEARAVVGQVLARFPARLAPWPIPPGP